MTLRYPYEVRDSNEYFHDIPDVKVAPDMLKLAEHILQSKETKFDPSQFVDRYEQAVLQLLEKKQQGMPAPKARPFVAPTNVINLMDTLRRSIAAEPKTGGAPKATAATTSTPKTAKGKKRAEGQRELLLPIAGRKGQPKDKTKPATQREGIKPAPQPAGRRKAG
jgi:DNA end-binding protein Ku